MTLSERDPADWRHKWSPQGAMRASMRLLRFTRGGSSASVKWLWPPAAGRRRGGAGPGRPGNLRRRGPRPVRPCAQCRTLSRSSPVSWKEGIRSRRSRGIAMAAPGDEAGSAGRDRRASARRISVRGPWEITPIHCQSISYRATYTFSVASRSTSRRRVPSNRIVIFPVDLSICICGIFSTAVKDWQHL